MNELYTHWKEEEVPESTNQPSFRTLFSNVLNSSRWHDVKMQNAIQGGSEFEHNLKMFAPSPCLKPTWKKTVIQIKLLGISVIFMAVFWFRRLVAGLSPRRLGFAPTSVHVGYVVDKCHWGSFFLRVLQFSPVGIIPPWLFILLRGGWTESVGGPISDTVSPHRLEQHYILLLQTSFL
jgi:hypothetical protein